MPLNALTDYIDSKEKEMIELLEKMVNIDCGTYCKEGVNQVGDLLAERSKVTALFLASWPEIIAELVGLYGSNGNLFLVREKLAQVSPSTY